MTAHPGNTDHPTGRKITVAGLIVNIFLFALKVWVGIISHSQALLADGIHSLSDLFTDFLTLWGIKYGRKEEDELHPFGHGRIETLASLFVGVLLILISLWISVSGILDIQRGAPTQPSGLAVWAAMISIVLKEALFQYTVRTGKLIGSQLLIANAWHHRSDAFSSVAVVLGVGATLVSPRLTALDIYAAILVSFFMIRIGLKIFAQAAREIIDTSPDRRVVQEIYDCAQSIEGVRGAHDLKARTSAGNIIMEIHIAVEPTITVEQGHSIAKQVETCILNDVVQVSSVVIHVDPHYEGNQIKYSQKRNN